MPMQSTTRIFKDHIIDWNNAKIVRREERWKERKILESIYIKSNSAFNLDSGVPLDQIWTDLITHQVFIVTLSFVSIA